MSTVRALHYPTRDAATRMECVAARVGRLITLLPEGEAKANFIARKQQLDARLAQYRQQAERIEGARV